MSTTRGGSRFQNAIPAFLIFLGAMVLVAIGLYAKTALSPTQSASAGPASAGPYRVDKANGHVVNVTLNAFETVQEIAPGVKYHVWTFDGTAPAPVIRVHLGDTVHFILNNKSTIGMQHSMDFHAAMTAWSNLPAAGSTTLTGNYQPVNPGESKTFDWVAMFPGVFMYHCGVPPVLEHISNGMYGAIIVEPNNLPKEREYVLVNSEFYPGDNPVNGVYEGDFNKMVAGTPKYVVWNGVADQYKASPLVARPNEKFRVWVVDAGPTLTSAFHVIGTMFNTYADGNPANVIYGDQTYNIPPGGGAMFELQIPDPGLYPFVTHAFAYAGRGAVGLIKIDPNAAAPPASYPMMADSFSAGVAPAKTIQPSGPVAGPTPSPGGGTGTTAACKPTGTTVKVSAKNVMFDKNCLAAPANKPFAIVFNNQDPGVPHNVAIYKDSTAAVLLFKGELVSGPTVVTYKVPALTAGTYFFKCDVHPQMNGTFVVK